MESDQRLKIKIKPEILQQFDTYFTLYDRSSLPLSWCIITEPEYFLPRPNIKGYFLLRVRPKPEHSETEIKVKSQLLKIDDSMQTWEIS